MEEDEFESAKRSYRRKKPRLCVHLDPETLTKFRTYAADNGYDMSKLIDKMIQRFLRERFGN